MMMLAAVGAMFTPDKPAVAAARPSSSAWPKPSAKASPSPEPTIEPTAVPTPEPTSVPEPTAVPPTPEPAADPKVAAEIRAIGECQVRMRQELHAPGGAEFNSLPPHIQHLENYQIKVRDAVVVPYRINYVCTVQFSEDYQTSEVVEFLVLEGL